jgi:hypothetical protein
MATVYIRPGWKNILSFSAFMQDVNWVVQASPGAI